MIHITIPTFRTLPDKREPYKRYNVYDLHVNGAFHASVRYSLLLQLHERLVATFGHRLNTPEFPPKSWRNFLDAKAANERRNGLAKYLHGVIQNPDIAKHPVLERAFLEFQLVSFYPTVSSTKLEVHLPDGRAIQLECYSDDSTNAVLKRLGEAIGMQQEHLQHFGLFLGRPAGKYGWEYGNDTVKGENGVGPGLVFDQICVRWLKNFESPFISQRLANKASDEGGRPNQKLMVRRVTWDPSTEEPLLEDAGCLKLLFLQALNDCQRGLIHVSAELKDRLNALQEQGNFKQFVHLCHQQADYGYELLAPVVADHPHPETRCNLKVGRRQIVLEGEREGTQFRTVLRSTRIKVYRVHTSSDDGNLSATHGGCKPEMTFQLEYLKGRDEFGVITLHTSQAVLLSLFLQSIAAEILQDKAHSASPTFKFNDNLSTKVIEQLEVSKANSIVSDDLSIKDYSIGAPENGDSGEASVHALWKIISYQMPFGEEERFEDIADSDL